MWNSRRRWSCWFDKSIEGLGRAVRTIQASLTSTHPARLRWRENRVPGALSGVRMCPVLAICTRPVPVRAFLSLLTHFLLYAYILCYPFSLFLRIFSHIELTCSSFLSNLQLYALFSIDSQSSMDSGLKLSWGQLLCLISHCSLVIRRIIQKSELIFSLFLKSSCQLFCFYYTNTMYFTQEYPLCLNFLHFLTSS